MKALPHYLVLLRVNVKKKLCQFYNILVVFDQKWQLSTFLLKF